MSDATAPETEETPPQPPMPRRRWRPRRLHYHLSFWSLVTIGLVALFLTLASMSFTGRVIVLPDWVTAKVLERMNTLMQEGSFSLRHVEFGVTPGGRPRLRLVDVGIKDATGLELAQLNGVEGGFRISAALVGRFEPTVLRLQGAQITLRRLADGTFALQLGQQSGATGNLATVLDTIDAAFTTGPLASTRKLEATDLTVTLEDARSGRLWQVTDGKLEIVPGEKVVDTTVTFDVFNGTEELATTEFGFRSARGSSEASLSARFSNAAAADIAAQSPALAFLSVLDAPISGALRSTLDATGNVSDLAGALEIGAGALSPSPGATPAAFDGAKVYIDFDPTQQRLDFQGASVQSELGTADAEGSIFLTDFSGGWPQSMVGQITLNSARLDPRHIFAAPLDVDRGVADIRLRLNPFSLDIGQAVLFRGDHRYEVSGQLSAGPDGWSASLDSRADSAGRDEILALWPLNVVPGTRKWVADRVLKGEAYDAALHWSKQPGGKVMMHGTFGLRNAQVRPIDSLPPANVASGYVSIEPASFTAMVDSATITAPDGNILDLSGTSYRLPDLSAEPHMGNVNLVAKGPMRAALSLLALPPFHIFAANSYGPDLARGEVSAHGVISFPVVDGPIPPEDLRYDIRADLTHLTSDRIIQQKLLVADKLQLVATDRGIDISGPVQIGQARAMGSWHVPIVDGKPGSAIVEGTIFLTPSSLREFGLGGLEDSVSGSARARFSLDFAGGGAPKLSLTSDLAGLGMTIPGTGWSKPANASGKLELAGKVGDRPVIDTLVLEAEGLSAKGKVTTAEGGGLGEATFSRVRIGGWLDAPVVLTGRGEGIPVSITVPGGVIDMRSADLDTGSSAPDGGAGPAQPLTLALDKLIVSEGIQFTDLRADLDLAGGLHGTFAGGIAGGDGAQINGTVAQSTKGAAFRITSPQAGGVLKGAHVFQSARGGELSLILAPVGKVGTYEGDFTIKDTRLVKAPTVAELLSAISVVGLLDQMGGEGMLFSEVEGRFRLEPNSVTLYRSSAVNASMGISLDGYYNTKTDKVDMQGVLSPLYLVNALGRILSPREGEGLVGFNFTLKGDFNDPAVEVNPLSILTPGAFREIFRRPPPKAPKDEAPAHE